MRFSKAKARFPSKLSGVAGAAATLGAGRDVYQLTVVRLNYGLHLVSSCSRWKKNRASHRHPIHHSKKMPGLRDNPPNLDAFVGTDDRGRGAKPARYGRGGVMDIPFDQVCFCVPHRDFARSGRFQACEALQEGGLAGVPRTDLSKREPQST